MITKQLKKHVCLQNFERKCLLKEISSSIDSNTKNFIKNPTLQGVVFSVFGVVTFIEILFFRGMTTVP